MENINQSDLTTTLANLYNMVHLLTDQIAELVTRFDTLESANQHLNRELDRMTAVVTQLSASNAAAKAKNNQTTSATVNNIAAKSIVTETRGIEASQYAPKTTTSVTDPTSWAIDVKKPYNNRGPTEAQKRIATARAFTIPSTEINGYDTVYIPRSRRLSRTEIQRRFHLLGIDINRIIDISLPARTVIGLLVHQTFKSELVATLQDCHIQIIPDFSPSAPEHIADPKYSTYSVEERYRLGKAFHQDRCIRTLRFIRPHLTPSVARYFIAQQWINETLATDIIKHRVPQPLKKRKTEDSSSIIDVLSRFRPTHANQDSDDMELEIGEEFAPGAFDSDSEKENDSKVKDSSEYSKTPIPSSQ
ncbi:hypothetical protein G6F25_012673 [Rhizopus arrhizus]|nr:hypothetical protein G6F25_012673 [Rhizopus arrhizus]